jgi:hypothetical protein
VQSPNSDSFATPSDLFVYLDGGQPISLESNKMESSIARNKLNNDNSYLLSTEIVVCVYIVFVHVYNQSFHFKYNTNTISI